MCVYCLYAFVGMFLYIHIYIYIYTCMCVFVDSWLYEWLLLFVVSIGIAVHGLVAVTFMSCRFNVVINNCCRHMQPRQVAVERCRRPQHKIAGGCIV